MSRSVPDQGNISPGILSNAHSIQANTTITKAFQVFVSLNIRYIQGKKREIFTCIFPIENQLSCKINYQQDN